MSRIAFLLVCLLMVGCEKKSTDQSTLGVAIPNNTLAEVAAEPSIDSDWKTKSLVLMQLHSKNAKQPIPSTLVELQDGTVLEFDHRCSMFGWYEFSCTFPKHVDDLVIANAFQDCWTKNRLDVFDEMDFESIAISLLKDTGESHVPTKSELPEKRWDVSLNAFRALDGSRNELWLRFQRTKDTTNPQAPKL